MENKSYYSKVTVEFAAARARKEFGKSWQSLSFIVDSGFCLSVASIVVFLTQVSVSLLKYCRVCHTAADSNKKSALLTKVGTLQLKVVESFLENC